MAGESEQDEDRARGTRWSTVAKLILAIGGPAVGWAGGSEWVREHLLRSLVLLASYEALVFFFQVVAEIWRRLKDRWLDAAARWVDYRVQELFSSYRRKYLQHIFYECRDFDVKGLSTQGTYTLGLQRVFVELSVDAQPGHEPSQGIIPKLPERVREGRHDIWEYLAVGRNFALIGPPGSGKTTVLRHVALVLALHRGQKRVRRAPRRLPVLLLLRSHAGAIAADDQLPLSRVIQCGDIVKELDTRCPAGWFDRQLRKGRCLVMMDGLDEVADRGARRKVVDWVERQMRTHSRNQFLVTSRPHGYRDNPLSGVDTLVVRPFSPEQVREFVSNWYLANEIISHNKDDPGVRKTAEKGARDLTSRIRGSNVLTDLAVNPLLLTMIATVHRFRSELPGRRVELYQEICEVFLGKRQDVRGVERAVDLTPSQKQCVLQPLAYHMMRERTREIRISEAAAAVEAVLKRVNPNTQAADFFKMIENTSGLLLERESGELQFAHKTFQEYLAAAHCHDERLESELAARVNDDWWNETIRLYVAHSDASPILEACFKDDPPSLSALVLAVECLTEAQQADEFWRRRVDSVLACEAEDARRQRVYGQALLSLRLRRMVPLDAHRWIDTKLLTQAEYQVFLDEMQGGGQYLQPDHWPSHHFARGDGLRAVAGVRLSDAEAFCRWLTEKEGPWLYRLPRSVELDEAKALRGCDALGLGATGCWATRRGTEGPYTAEVSDVVRQEFFKNLKGAVEETYQEDKSAACNYADTNLGPPEGFLQLDSALERALHRAIDLDLGRAVDQALERPLTPEQAHQSGMDRALDSTVDLTSLLPRTRASALYLALVWGCGGRNVHRPGQLTPPPGWRGWLFRAVLQLLAPALQSPGKTQQIAGLRLMAIRLLIALMRVQLLLLNAYYRYRHRNRAAAVEASRKQALKQGENWLDVYVQYAVVEGRRQGKVPVLGGIRIVRERRN